jgi:hypothetical protein
VLAAVVLGGSVFGQEGPAQKTGPNLWGRRVERLDATQADQGLQRSSAKSRIGTRVRRESYFRYHVVGGEQGIDRVLTIRGDGTARLAVDGEVTKVGTLEPHILKQLGMAIKKKGDFKHLEPVYGEKSADPFQKTTTLVMYVSQSALRSSQGRSVRPESGRTRTVTVYEDPDNPPPVEIQRIFDSLDELVDRRLTDRPEMQVEFLGVAVSGMIDRHVYRVIREETPRVPSLWFHLSVVNFTEIPLHLRFETRQPYEIVIRDELGDEVYRWSDGKDFDVEPTEIDLVADWLSYIERIPLSDVEGGPLPPGAYRIEYEVLSDPAFRGEATFRIEYIDPPEAKQPFKGILARHRAATGSASAGAAEKTVEPPAKKAGAKSGGGGKKRKKGER